MDVAAEEKKQKELQAKLRRSSNSLSAEDLQRLREWELGNLYDKVANVALFERVECLHCGHHQTTFTRLLQHHVHRRVKTEQRWVAVDECDPKLPNRTQMRVMTAPMCIRCLPDHDFSLKGVQKWQA